jgi:hypothetical protein
VPRWNPPQRSLGASALVAVVVAGCGAAGTQQKPALHASAEKHLLSLVARARADAERHDGAAVHAVLGDFVSEVRTLKTAGQLTGTTAVNLDGEAHAAAAQAKRQLHAAKSASAEPGATTQTSTAPAAADATAPTTPTVPPSDATTTPAPARPSPTAPTPKATTSTPPAAGATSQQDDQGGDGSGAPWPGRGHGHGHGYGHSYGSHAAAWWSALRNWFHSQSGAGNGDD